MSEGSESARYTSIFPIGPTKLRGRMPATVREIPLIKIVLPTMLRSPPNTCCHAGNASIATRDVSESASSERKSRPNAGETPNVEKKSGCTHASDTMCAPPSPLYTRLAGNS
jgi:hypothetical protein